MANLRRHFNFSTKQSVEQNQNSSESNVPPAHFDKCSFMSDICSCLDICCSYIQALNALCGAGSMLARNLLQTVHNVPMYHNIAQQFLMVWDEVGKATAGASAAVKTETLMMLQEVLNTLEMGVNDSSLDVTLSESFQVIGSCLFSFIELQTQFSLTTWKSLSKLSKTFANDAFLHSLNWKSHDRGSLKVSKNSQLSSTIKKHFSQLSHKTSDYIESPQSQFYIPPSLQTENLSANHQFVPQSQASSTTTTDVWSPTKMWPSNESPKSVPYPQGSNLLRASVPSAVTVPELDEVINLLSCMPIGQRDLPPMKNQRTCDASVDAQPVCRFWPPGAGPVSSRHMGAHRSWSEGSRDITFGYDSWIWRSDNLNCNALPDGETQNYNDRDQKQCSQITWDSTELQRWNVGVGENGSSSDDASSCQGADVDSISQRESHLLGQQLLSAVRYRRHSSSDGLPDAVENFQDEDYYWNIRNQKVSTWPLKQPSSKIIPDLNWPSGSTESKLLSLYYPPNS